MSNIRLNYLKGVLIGLALFVFDLGYGQSAILVAQSQLSMAESCQIICSATPDTIDCNQSFDVLPTPSVDNCLEIYSVQLASETYIDDNFCDDNMKKVERLWQAMDGSGNELSSCVQTVVINKTDVSFPKDIVWTAEQYNFSSSIIEPTPVHESIFDLDEYDGENDIDVDPGLSNFVIQHTGAGFPKGAEDASCMYDVTYSDSIALGCKQSFQVFRKWTVFEQCSGVTIVQVQKISVNDHSSNANLENSPGYELNGMHYEYHVTADNDLCKSTSFILFPQFFGSIDTNSIVASVPSGELVNTNSKGGWIPSPGLNVGSYTDGLKIQVNDSCGNTETLLVTLVVDVSNKPSCNAPQNVSVSCADFNIDLSTYGSLATSTGCGSAIDSIESLEDWGAYDTICHTGVITRYWSVWDADGNTGSCLQKITVVPPLAYSIQFPDDVMNGSIDTVPPVFVGSCGAVSWNVYDEKDIPDGQSIGKIYRTYTTVNNCDFNPDFQPEMVANPDNTTAGSTGIATLQNHGVLSYTMVIDNFTDIRLVTGNIQSENGIGIKKVTVNILSSDPNHPIYTTTTDEDGYYSLKLPVASSYIVKPVKLDDTYQHGIDANDANILYKHILIIPQITSPYKILAANVLAGNSAKVKELLEIQKLILNKIEGFDNVPVWTFAEASVDFPKPQNPYDIHYASHQLVNLQDDHVVNFVGIKYGDLDDSAVSLISNNLAIQERSEEVVRLSVDDVYLEAGTEYEIPFNLLSEKNIMSYQFSLDFDNESLEFVKLMADDDLIENDFNLENIENGQLATAHIGKVLDGAPIFMIQFKAKVSGFLSQMLDISDAITPSKAFDDELNPMKLELIYQPSNSRNTLILFQNEPNPFRDMTTIKFELQNEEKISLTIYSSEGQVVAQKEKIYPSGLHQEVFLENIFMQKGIYFYRIETADHVYVKKMIKF